MHIGLDYDQTYTEDPPAWQSFIELMQGRGHRVSIVTFRDRQHDTTPMLNDLERCSIVVRYTAGAAKRGYMIDVANDPVDVWIDDRPESIVADSTMTPEQLEEWRYADRIARGVNIVITRPAG